MEITAVFKAALAYAKFENKELKNQVKLLITSHENDLDDVGYVPSVGSVKLAKEITSMLDELDEASAPSERLLEAVRQAHEEEETAG